MKNLPLVIVLVFLATGAVVFVQDKQQEECYMQGEELIWGDLYGKGVYNHFSYYNTDLRECLFFYVQLGKRQIISRIISLSSRAVLAESRYGASGKYESGLSAEEFFAQSKLLMGH